MFALATRAAQALEKMSCELEPELLDGRDAARLLEMVARWEKVCASLRARLARRVDETKVWRDGGHRSAAHFVAETAGTTVGAAARALETVRALEELPETAEAFRAGELSETQAAEIASAASEDPGAETALLETAAATSVKGLRDRCRQVRAGAQPDDEAWARHLHVSRRANRWRDNDGAWRADIRLSPDAGARVDSAWDAHLDRIFAEARRAGHREPRHAYEADAFVASVTEGPCKPIEARLEVTAAALPRGHTEPGERCEIAGSPIPVTTARALLADSRVTVLARDGNDVTEISEPTRTIPARLRRQLEARYPTCGVKTCANDRFLEIDHVVPVAEGGRSKWANAWRICPHHHHLKTYFGWKVVGTTHDWDLVPPDDPDPP
ncbi:MAG: DUF222 domain-containing protein [Actinobacteria bacterium]|nr:DUF222 domain-containing protein [Actinomycetota bacterium]